ncbi:MAG: hypothetical protein REJ23_08205 [Brevundimonas sp.]|nr:hypothetical protein [Brevundimonas sp.]
MRGVPIALFLLGLILPTTPAFAQTATVQSAPGRATVVIYRDQPVDTASLMTRSASPWDRLDQEGLALIIETREIDLPAGEAIIRFSGVATGIVPESAVLSGLPARVLERNTDFDLLTPASLVQRSIGETVTVARTNPTTGEQILRPAVIRAGAAGPVLEIDGRFEALDCSGLTERILFDRVPEGLSDQPILSVRTHAEQAGRHTVTLAYLATGLQWSADYVARVNPDGRTLTLSGWLTLANFGGTGFRDAPVQVVAGTLNRDDATVPVEPVRTSAQPSCWPQDTTTRGLRLQQLVGNAAPGIQNSPTLDEIVVTGSRISSDEYASDSAIMAEQGELGDYKIYSLPGTTDVLARQTKQVRFLERHNVRFSRIYRQTVWASTSQEPQTPQLLLRLRNQTRDGLGAPLPGGGVALMESREGRAIFAGQARFDDRAVGLPVELAFGTAMDLTVSHKVEAAEGGDAQRLRQTFTVTIRNDKPERVEVEIVPGESQQRGFRIVESSQRPVITDGGLPAWRIRMPANGGVQTLTYTIEYGD